MLLLWLGAGKPFHVPVPRSAIIDRAAPGKADKIADAARIRDLAAERAIGDLLPLDGADRLLHAFGRELSRRAANLVDLHVLEIAGGQIIGLPPREEIGVVALDSNLHQGLHDCWERDPFLVRGLAHLAHHIPHVGVHNRCSSCPVFRCGFRRQSTGAPLSPLRRTMAFIAATIVARVSMSRSAKNFASFSSAKAASFGVIARPGGVSGSDWKRRSRAVARLTISSLSISLSASFEIAPRVIPSRSAIALGALSRS